MKHTLLFLFCSLASLAQPRQNEPLPYFAKKPIQEIKKDLTGWVQSTDGQWLSDKMRIPLRRVARDDSREMDKTDQLGLDNIEELQLIPVIYKQDTLAALVKLFQNGSYEYAKTKKHWHSNTEAHYYIFDASQLSKLKNLEEGQAQLIKIKLLAEGKITEARNNKISKQLEDQVVINPKLNQEMVFTIKSITLPGSDDSNNEEALKLVRFQIHSTHTKADDLHGVIQDFRIGGLSLYGSMDLLNYLYYECSRELYENFLTMRSEFKLLK